MIGQTLNERYVIEAEIGRGGIGVVYRAHDATLDRDVAIKVLSQAAASEETHGRLLNEARSAARLNHPNIVAVYDAHETPLPFIVEELVSGRSLYSLAQQRAPEGLTIEEIQRIGGQICDALQHAHDHGIVHRDLKTENVLLAADGTVKLSDFGLARSLASNMMGEGSLAGTVFYMAPEVISGQVHDVRSDLYALGVLLYEMAAGRPPFSAEDPVAVLSQHLHAPHMPARHYNPSLPVLLDVLLSRLLSKRPDDRPSSAAATAQALAAIGAPTDASRDVPLLERIGRGRLVAREQELAEMEGVWRRVVAGAGHVLLVSGEPGIGKTRVVRELMARAQASGAKAFYGQCNAEGGAPYAPMAQIIRQGFDDASLADVALPAAIVADLAILAPDLHARFPNLLPNPALDAASEQQRVFESVVSACVGLAARAPLLIAIDDVQWADSGSLFLLRHLAMRTRNMRILLICAYREVDLDEARPWHQVMLDLNRERLATRIKLASLSREQARAMLGALFDEEISDAFLDGVYRETEGNPFFIEEVCKALIEDGNLVFQNGRWQQPNMDQVEVPQSVRIAIQMRVGRLPQATQDVLRLAAILGRQFDYDVLRRASELSEDDVLGAVENAERAQLISEAQGARLGQTVFSFSHVLIAAALRESLSGLRRQRLHRRAAAAVEVMHPDDYEALAYHYHQAGDAERARELYGKAAARALSVYAHREAEQGYRMALDLGGEGTERAELLNGLGESLAPQGKAEALEAWRQAIGLYTSERNDAQAARLYARSVDLLWGLDRVQEGLALAREALVAVEGQAESPGMAALLHQAARLSYFTGLVDEAAPLCRKALALAERLNLVEERAQSLITMALVYQREGRYRAGIASLEEALHLAQSANLLLTACRAHNNLSVLLDATGDVAEAAEHCRSAAQLAAQARAPGAEIFYWSNYAADLFLMADLAGIERILPRLYELAQLLPDLGRAEGMLRGAELYALELRGEWDEVFQRSQRVYDELTKRNDPYSLAAITLHTAQALLQMERFAEAVPVAWEAVDLNDRYGSAAFPRLLLVMAHAGEGECSQARRVLGEAQGRNTGPEPLLPDAAFIALAEAHVLACERDWTAAVGAFEQAAAILARCDQRFLQACTLIDWAGAHARRNDAGDRRMARQLLEQALAIFAAAPSPGYVARIMEKHRAVGLGQ